jgi:CRP-like cAMP-binding protein
MRLALLEALHQLSAQAGLQLPELQAVEAAVQVRALPEREAAFDLGAACPRIFVVRSGLMKQRYLKEDGSEWIKSFTAAGDAFACPFALRAGGRCSFASIAIEPSVVESVDFALIERLGDLHPHWQKAIRLGFQALVELKVARERELLMHTAEELYGKFVAAKPELARRVPQKDLAAFLGVTPVGLNRIVRRSRLAAVLSNAVKG